MAFDPQLIGGGLVHSSTPPKIDNGSYDNCGTITKALNHSSFTCSNLGPDTVTLTITEASGNTRTSTDTLTAEGALPEPKIIVPPSGNGYTGGRRYLVVAYFRCMPFITCLM